MRETIKILQKCQQHDVVIFELQEKLKSIPVSIAGLEKRFESERTDLLKLEEHLKATKVKLSNKEGELRTKEDQILKHEGQLMQVKTNKEYAALQGEINLGKKKCADIEEEIIISLDEIAGIESEIAIEKKRLDGKKQELDQEKKSFAVIEADATSDISKRTVERNEQLARVDKPVRVLYERIVQKRNGSALAKINDQQCGGCGMKMRPQVIHQVRMWDNLVMCDSCSRILYVDE